MRFHNYLTETTKSLDNVPQEFIELIKRDCKPFLAWLKPERRFFYRGSSYDGNIYGMKKRFDAPRRPQGMYREVADGLNHWLQSHGHLRRDGAIIITTPNYEWAEEFGDMVNIVFPIGPFKHTSFEGQDINVNHEKDWPQKAWHSDNITVAFGTDAQKRDVISSGADPSFKPDDMKDWITSDTSIHSIMNWNWETWFTASAYYFITLRGIEDTVKWKHVFFG